VAQVTGFQGAGAGQGDGEVRRLKGKLNSRIGERALADLRIYGFASLLLCLSMLASCTSVPTPVPTYTYAPTLTPTSAPSPTTLPSPTPTPAPTSTPTPAPTLDPAAVTMSVAKERARLAEAGVEPLCLRWEDTDNDGVSEWVGLYMRSGEPPELTGFVLDGPNGDAWYNLLPLKKEPGKEDFGLGEYPACELEVRDTNADGRIEILIWGHAKTSTGLLHIFVWDGTTYTLLGAFEGDAGVRLENADGDLADEISIRYDARSGLVWEAVHTWDGANYGWTWERYDWFYLDRPHAYLTDTPEHVVISFYLAIDDRDIPGAYSLLSGSAQASQSYDGWAVGFATTIAAEVGVVHERTRSGDVALVAAQVLAYDNVDGRVVAMLWDVEWTVVQTDGGWRLESAGTEQLDQWDVEYYR
jgi:hypothetical protein